jgi:hypothetical protein
MTTRTTRGTHTHDLEQRILEAVANDDDNLMDLLQEAIETMDEQKANLLLDKVNQMYAEAASELRGWRE